MKYFLPLLLLTAVLGIDQMCQSSSDCPPNSYCLLDSDMCACNPGYIGGCNTPAIPLTSSSYNTQITYGQTLLFYINPMQLNVFIQFIFTICLSGTQTINTTLTLWGETGDDISYTPYNSLGSPSPASLYSGCQQFIAPYTSFGTQPNGQNEMLIFGLTDTTPGVPAAIEVSVSQQVVAGFFLYYYIIIALIVVVVLAIIIGVSVCIYRRRRRRNGSLGLSPAVPEPAFNNIDYFQQYMPAVAAAHLGIADKRICSICLQNIELSQIVRQTICKHTFHATCIDSWCLKNLNCPVCRTDFSYDTIEQTIRNLNNSNFGGSENVQGAGSKQEQIQISEPLQRNQQVEMIQIEPPRYILPPGERICEYRQEKETNRAIQIEITERMRLDSPKQKIRQQML